MRTHGAAAMLVRIYQRRKGDRAFDGGVKLDSQFEDKTQIGTKAGGDDQFIRRDTTPAGRSGADPEAISLTRQMRHPKFRFDLDLTRGHQGCEFRAELAARRKPVVCAAAKCLGGIVSA